jgi:hypothetical protein
VTTLLGRSSSRRWVKLSVLLTSLERGVEALARIDAHTAPTAPRRGRPPIDGGSAGLLAFDARLRALEQRLDRELDRLTVERLTLDLEEKQRRCVA